jgi:zinc protease
VEAATDKVIAKLLKDGVTEAEVKRAQKRLVRSSIFTQDSQSTLARIYGGSMTLGSTIESIQSWPDRINEITVEDVNSVARKYLKLKRSVTGYLKPETAAHKNEG